MPDKLLLLSIAGFFVFSLMFIILLFISRKNSDIARERLKDLSEYNEFEQDLYDIKGRLSPIERLFKPFMIRFSRLFARFSSDKLKEEYRIKILRTGDDSLTLGKIYGLKGVFAVIFPHIALSMFFNNAVLIKKVIIGIITLLTGFYLPDFMLYLKIKKRQEKIQSQMPFILDLLVVCVESGLAFEAALNEVVERVHNEFSKELNTFRRQLRANIDKIQALDELYERIGIEDVKEFCIAIKSTEELGVPIKDILKAQSEAIHEKTKQRARQKAQKIPIKLLFPMIFFIFPTLFIILLSPAAIQIYKTFSGLK